MSTQTLALTDFLLERIAEDERHARKLAETDPRPVLSLASTVNHPERLLLECKAKWAIRSEHLPVGYRNTRTGETDEYCPTCVSPKSPPHSYPCRTIRQLAAIYADHDDYDETWRP